VETFRLEGVKKCRFAIFCRIGAQEFIV